MLSYECVCARVHGVCYMLYSDVNATPQTCSWRVMNAAYAASFCLFVNVQEYLNLRPVVSETVNYYEVAIGPALNPLPINDAHMRHGLSISHKNLYRGFNTRRCTSVHGFCFFSCFLWLVRG